MNRLGRILLALTVSSVGVVVGALTIPFIRLPSPTGTFAVGTLDVELPGGTLVTLWYPARSSPDRPAPYRPEVTNRSLRERLVFSIVRTTARRNAPVAAGAHAVVVYLPGWGEQRSDNTALCEELASQGYVVAAMDDLHPEPGMDFSSAAALRETLRWADAKVELQSRGASGVLTALEHLASANPAHRVTSTMDFSRVAAVGFSFGGASAAEMALHDPRVRGAVNLDGWIFGEAARRGVDKPFMIVGTGAATVDPPANGVPQAIQLGRFEGELDAVNGRQIMAGFRRYGGYNVTVDGTQHESFCDTGILPLRLRPIPGSIDGRRAQRIVVAYVDQFLDAALNGRPAPLLAPRSGELTSISRSRLDRAAELTVWTSPAAVRRSRVVS